MKKLLFLYVPLLLTCSVYAQNLVPNYSFENITKCIQGPNQFSGYVDNWTGGSSGLCYFTSVCNVSSDSVPLNTFGYQNAHTGQAYAGILTYIDDTCNICVSDNKNGRDYIQDSLSDTLKKGIRYYVTFYVSLADSSWFSCGEIGAYFSDSALYYASWLTYTKSYLIPQVANNSTKDSLNNTVLWTKVSGSFLAQGGEKYIVIGNFKTDSNSQIGNRERLSTNNAGAYYYIDDVIVSTDSNYADSLAGVAELKVENEKLKVFPNPSKGVFTIESSVSIGKSLVEIYNELGQKVYSTPLNLPQGRDFEIDLTSQPSGVYLYRVITEQGDLVGSGKLLIAH